MVTLARLRSRDGASMTGTKKPKRDLFVVNTHYDDQGAAARQHSSELILRRLGPALAEAGSSALVILTGDLNSRPEDDGYRILTGHRYDPDARTSKGHAFLDSGHELARAPKLKTEGGQAGREERLLSKPYGQRNTWTGFDPREERMLIDFVLAADNGAVATPDRGTQPGQWRVKRYGVLPTKYEGKPRSSDHRPVVVLFEQQTD
jgi:endonuclease/exonuclease/phosphatase family metal-dependent hydrolase